MDVLVLNADFNCINSVSWKRAFNLIISGKVEVVKYSDKVINNYDSTHKFKVPKVIRLLKFIASVYNAKVPFHKKNVLVRDKFTCQYCGTKKGRMTIDHIIPLSKGGDTSWKNCVAACHECNKIKADKLLEHLPNMKLRNVPKEPNIMKFYKNKYDKFNISDIKEMFT